MSAEVQPRRRRDKKKKKGKVTIHPVRSCWSNELSSLTLGTLAHLEALAKEEWEEGTALYGAEHEAEHEEEEIVETIRGKMESGKYAALLTAACASWGTHFRSSVRFEQRRGGGAYRGICIRQIHDLLQGHLLCSIAPLGGRGKPCPGREPFRRARFGNIYERDPEQ